MKNTFVGLIKPDGVDRTDAIIDFVLRNGEFRIIEVRYVQLDESTAKKIIPSDLEWLRLIGEKVTNNLSSVGLSVKGTLGKGRNLPYKEIGDIVRGWNVIYLTNGVCVLLVIVGDEEEAKKFKNFVGPTDTENQNTVRGFFRKKGSSMLESTLKGESFFNTMHASDPGRANYEKKILLRVPPLRVYKPENALVYALEKDTVHY